MNKLFCVGLVISATMALTACAYDNATDANKCADVVRVAGEPDMTKAPQFSVNGVSSGAALNVSIFVDADVSFVDLRVGGITQSGDFNYYPVVTETVSPANQTLQYQIDTTGYQTGAYFLWVNLCSDGVDTCSNTSSGTGVIYTLKYRDAPTPEYVRQVYWQAGAVNSQPVDACIVAPLFYVN